MALVTVHGTWLVDLGQDVLGEIWVTGVDFPWAEGSWVQADAFGRVQPLFEAELDLLNKGSVPAEWEAAYRRILDMGVRLRRPDGRPVPEFLLHIEGQRAWFRWNDHPFQEERPTVERT